MNWAWYIFPAPVLSPEKLYPPTLKQQTEVPGASFLFWTSSTISLGQFGPGSGAVVGEGSSDWSFRSWHLVRSKIVLTYVQRLGVGLGNIWIYFEHGTVVQTNRPEIDLLKRILLLCMSLAACCVSSSKTPLGPTNMIVPFSTTMSGSFAHFWKGSGSVAGCPDLTWNNVQRSKGLNRKNNTQCPKS